MTEWRTSVSAIALAGMMMVSAPFAASAQDAEEEGARRTVDQITVTAQKREESVQDVPLSVAAYDEQIIEDAGITDIKDLVQIAPGLMVTSTQSETITTARIRGIGTVGDNFGLESSVGVYIDGVFRARNGVSFGDLGEIAGIEVLRGPQGTLFGKNTSAGVINVLTKEPEFEYSHFLEATVGNFDQTKLSVGSTGAVVEDLLAYRIFATAAQRDGYNDLVLGTGNNQVQTDVDNQDYYSTRGQLLFTPTETFDLRVIGDFTNRSENCCSGVAWDYSPEGFGLVAAVGGETLFPADPEERTAFANEDFTQDVEDWGFSAEFNWDVGPGTITGITALRNWENSRSQDVDYTTADIAFRTADSNFTELERFSQEIRYAGATDRLDWLVGAFFSNEELELGDAIRLGDDWETFLSLVASGGASPTFVVDTLNDVAIGGGAPAGPFTPGTALPAGGIGPVQDLYNQDATSWAVFTHNTFSVTDQLDITLGLRYTNEEKDLLASFETGSVPGCAFLEGAFGADPATASAAVDPTLPPLVALICLPYARTSLDAFGYDQTFEDEEVSGTLRASFRFTDDLLAYGGFARGYKAGGFNLDRTFDGGTAVDTNADGIPDSFQGVDPSFESEITEVFEFGVKTEWFDNSLLLNANAFFQTVEDFQLNSFNGIAFVVDSVPELETNGLEVDFLYFTPLEGLDLQGGFAYVDAQYGDFETGNVSLDALSGQQSSLSPEYFLNLGASYEQPVGDNLVMRLRGGARYVSDYNTGSDLDPEKEQEAFTLLDARIGLGRQDGLWTVELFGNNLTDETYAQVAFDAFAQGARAGTGTSLEDRATASYAAFLGAPRTYGVTLRTEF